MVRDTRTTTAHAKVYSDHTKYIEALSATFTTTTLSISTELWLPELQTQVAVTDVQDIEEVKNITLLVIRIVAVCKKEDLMDLDSFIAANNWELNKSASLLLEEIHQEWLAMKKSFLYEEQNPSRPHEDIPVFVSKVKEAKKHSDGVNCSSSSSSSNSNSSKSISSSSSNNNIRSSSSSNNNNKNSSSSNKNNNSSSNIINSSDVRQKNWKVKKKITNVNTSWPSEGLCRQQTDSLEILRKRGNRQLTCSICGLLCQHNAHFQIHMRTHTGEKPFKCSYCERAFAQKSDLTKHERIHTGEKPFKCDICEKAFAIGKSLQDHRRQHTGEKPYECIECKRRFRNSSGLSEHRKTHRKQYEREMFSKGDKRKRGAARCNYCSKSYSNRQKLLCHIRMVHTKDVPYQCAKCQTCYSSIYSLCLHVSVTHGHTLPQQESLMIPSYKCSRCMSKFTSQVALIKHMQDCEHKYFTCDVCDVTVEDLEQLINHRWQHTVTQECQLMEKRKKISKTAFCKGMKKLGGNGQNNKIKKINIKKQRDEILPGKLRVMTILPIEAFKELSGDVSVNDIAADDVVGKQELGGTAALRKIRRMSTYNMNPLDSPPVMMGTDYVFRSCNKKEKNKRMSLLANKKPSKHESLKMRQMSDYGNRSTPETELHTLPSYCNSLSLPKVREEDHHSMHQKILCS
nr:zinc finger protein 468-like [Cherax quadricarinatus]